MSRQKKTLSSWLSNRFQLIIRDVDTFEERKSYPFTYAKLILFLGLAFSLMFGISFALSTTILERWFDPRYKYMETDRKVIDLERQVDSLSEAVSKKDQYIHNIQDILQGNVQTEENFEDAAQINSNVETADITAVGAYDSSFRAQFETSGQVAGISSAVANRNFLEQMFFFPPITGVISDHFNPRGKHFGVDVVAKANEPIKAVADGTVIMASWTQDSGYVIGVQHRNNILSFYKHNSTLLKKAGEQVKAGDIVAIIGNSGELTDGPHLHFELWYNRVPVDPTNFIMFE